MSELEDGPDEDQRRRYYQMTAKGRRALAREAPHLESLLERVRNRLEPAVENTKR
jgi:DNA-binding PadR family transcriptional regulator